jgi:hypothetical protein
MAQVMTRGTVKSRFIIQWARKKKKKNTIGEFMPPQGDEKL